MTKLHPKAVRKNRHLGWFDPEDMFGSQAEELEATFAKFSEENGLKNLPFKWKFEGDEPEGIEVCIYVERWETYEETEKRLLSEAAWQTSLKENRKGALAHELSVYLSEGGDLVELLQRAREQSPSGS